MASPVEICNRALQKLGAKRIVSLSEDSKNARACATSYQVCKDAELEKHTWGFSVKRVQLAASATPPAFGPKNAFPLPSDFLRLLPPDPQDNFNDRDWIREGNLLLSNYDAPLNVRYVARIEDVNLMPPSFREAVAARLGKEMCEELTQSNSKQSALDQHYKEAITEARRTNAIQKPAAESYADPWITVRS